MGDVIRNYIKLARLFLSAGQDGNQPGTDGIYPTGTGGSGNFHDHWRNYSVWENFRCIYRSHDCILVR